MGNSVLVEIGGFLWSHPYVTCSLLVLFTPPFFPILKFFFPLLISTAVFIVALVTMGPQIEGSSDDGFEPHESSEEKTSDGKGENLKDGERESKIQKPGKEKITWRDRVQKCKQTGLHWIEQQLRNDNWRGASLNDDNVSILEEAFAHKLPARPVEFRSIPSEKISDRSVRDEPNLERVQVRDVSKSEPWESFSGGDYEMPPPPFTLDNDTRDLPHDFFSPHPSFHRRSHESDEDIMRPPIEFDMPPVITGPASVTAPFMMKEPEPELEPEPEPEPELERVIGIDTDSYDDSDHHECHHDDDEFTESEDERDLSPKILAKVPAETHDQPAASTDIQEEETSLPTEPSPPPPPPPELEEDSQCPVPDPEEQTSTPPEIHDETATPSISVEEEVSIPAADIDPESTTPALDAPEEQSGPELEPHEDAVPPATILHEERSIPATEIHEEALVPLVAVEEGSVNTKEDDSSDLHDIPDLVDISPPEPEEPALEAAASEECALEAAAHEEPVLEAAAHEEPILEAAAHEERPHEEPALEAAAHEEPALEATAHEEPALEAAAHEEPALEEPAHEEPAHEEPTHEEPAHEEPAHEEPACEDNLIPVASTLDDAEAIQAVHSVDSKQPGSSADVEDHSHGSQGTSTDLPAPSEIQEEPPQSLERSLSMPSPEELTATEVADSATEATHEPPMTTEDPPASEDIHEQPPELDHSVSLPATPSESVHSRAPLEPMIIPPENSDHGPASPDTDIGGDSTPEREMKGSLVGQLSSSEINNSLTSEDEVDSPRAVPAKLYKEKLLSLDALANSIVESPSPDTKPRLLEGSKGQPPTTDEKVSHVTDKLKGFIEDGPSRRFQPDAPELQITPPSGRFSLTASPSRSLMISPARKPSIVPPPPARKPSIVPPPPARNIRPQVSSSDESSEDEVDLDSDIEIVGTDSDSDADSLNYARIRPPPKLPPHLRQTSARA